ncbi:MAG: hypothetical protein GX073_00385 [Firmicutes bacterium]|nr:hypothetical protein [Bacillota bacterium]
MKKGIAVEEGCALPDCWSLTSGFGRQPSPQAGQGAASACRGGDYLGKVGKGN